MTQDNQNPNETKPPEPQENTQVQPEQMNSAPDYLSAARFWKKAVGFCAALCLLCWAGLEFGGDLLPEPLLRALNPLRFFSGVAVPLSAGFSFSFGRSAKKQAEGEA